MPKLNPKNNQSTTPIMLLGIGLAAVAIGSYVIVVSFIHMITGV